MPELRATFEVGPQLNVLLWQSDNQLRRLQLQLPVRAAYTIERRPESQGVVAHPKINLDMRDVPGWPGWGLGVQLGPLFGSREQHQAIYGVEAADARAGRPAYQARGGYAGLQFLTGVSKRYRSHWVGAFVRVDSLHGASFVDSPLVRTRQYVAGGVAVSWILGESSRRVAADD
jgi:outer membrane scaffolding protein for murein synthesis (MipA/OmpV family)